MLRNILNLISLIISIFLFIEPFYCISFIISFETIQNSLLRTLKIIGSFSPKDETLDYMFGVIFLLNFFFLVLLCGSFTYRVIIHQHYDFLDLLSKYKIIPKTHHHQTEDSLSSCYQLVHTLLNMNTQLALNNQNLMSMNSELEAERSNVLLQFQKIQEIHKKLISDETALDWSEIMNVEKTPRLNE